MTRKSQKSGNSSTNIQAESITMQVGIDEKRAREVFQEMNSQLKNEYTKEALNIANARVLEFENSLMPKMHQVDGALEAFADPSFQRLLVEAQKAAASTERHEDYDLLSELMVHRFRTGEDRIERAGVSYAIDIVDKISSDALLGLTVIHSFNNFTPTTGDIFQGLDVLNELFGQILYDRLPFGQDWIDHLDMLNSIRSSSLSSFQKIRECYPRMLYGYVDVGIEKISEDYVKAIEILNSNQLPTDILVDHAFNNNFQRLFIPNRRGIDTISLWQNIMHEGKAVLAQVKLSDSQVRAINSVYDLYSQNSSLKENNVNMFMAEWDRRPNLKILREWWDKIPIGFSLTSVGKVLAHSNAQRCEKSLPPIS